MEAVRRNLLPVNNLVGFNTMCWPLDKLDVMPRFGLGLDS